MGADHKINELFKLITPYARKKFDNFRENNGRFVHYTSAEVLMSILTHREVWLRNSRIMNDFREVDHGEQCLLHCWNSTHGDRLKGLLESSHYGLAERLANFLQETKVVRREHTYLLSLSEHGGEHIDEDRYGRLSMWRAYGGDVNVALVLKNGPFLTDSTSLNAFTTPVYYSDELGFAKEFEEIVNNVERSEDTLKELEADDVLNSLIVALHSAILATKHPGFSEEREWRVWHSPTIWSSERLTSDFVTVGGVPQRIFKIPLADDPENNLTGAEIPDIIDRIIIGPNNYPMQIAEAIWKKLEDLGVSDIEKKITVSDIPLRK